MQKSARTFLKNLNIGVPTRTTFHKNSFLINDNFKFSSTPKIFSFFVLFRPRQCTILTWHQRRRGLLSTHKKTHRKNKYITNLKTPFAPLNCKVTKIIDLTQFLRSSCSKRAHSRKKSKQNKNLSAPKTRS